MVEPLHLSARAPEWYNEAVFQGGVSQGGVSEGGTAWKGVKSALRRTDTAWKNKIRTCEDCELPGRAVTVFFCVQKGSTQMNVKQID